MKLICNFYSPTCQYILNAHKRIQEIFAIVLYVVYKNVGLYMREYVLRKEKENYLEITALLNFKQGAARSHSNSYLEIDIFVFATLVYWHLAIMELFLRKAIWRSIKIHLGLSVKHLQLLGKAECCTFSKCKYNRFEIFYFKSIGFF